MSTSLMTCIPHTNHNNTVSIVFFWDDTERIYEGDDSYIGVSIKFKSFFKNWT